MNGYEMEMFINKNLNGNEYKVYRNLLAHRNIKEKVAFPSQSLIAEEVSISVSSVKRAIQGLVAKKFVKTTACACKNGRYNKYELMYIPDYKKKDNTICDNKLNDIDNSEFLEMGKNINSNKKQATLVESKTNIKLTKWQRYVCKHMESSHLLQAIGLYNRKQGRTFSFLLSLYVGILYKKDLFTLELSKIFKVEWTGNYSDYLTRQEQVSDMDEYDKLLHSVYTLEEIEELKNNKNNIEN